LERGQRVTELMKQKQYSPLSIAEQAVSLFAANNGFIDDVELKKVSSFEAALHSYMKAEHKALMDKINASGDYNDDIAGGIRTAIETFKKTSTW
jgi:F-type H+-transporting ATPase subunit alpha